MKPSGLHVLLSRFARSLRGYRFIVYVAACLACFQAVLRLQNELLLRQCSRDVDRLPTKSPAEYGSCSRSFSALHAPSPTPWSSIGGCGAGGSGGGVEDGLQWIGNGVQGGLVDVEILPRYVIRKSFNQVIVPPRLSVHLPSAINAGVTIPIMTKNGDVQYMSNQEPQYHSTGGIGDIVIDASRPFGFSGAFDIQASLTLPTGQYDIKRGSDQAMRFLPVDFQMGSGVYCAGLKLSCTFDREEGFWKVDGSYNHPFNMKPFTSENAMMGEYFEKYRDRKGSRRFYYRFKPYGESDLGAYVPPSVSLAGYYAYRGREGYVHTWGACFNAPLGVAWIPSPDVSVYDPRPDPDNMMWSGALIYELEFSRPKYPILLGISLPLHDRRDGRGGFDAPQWGDFMNEWIFALGIRSTMF